MSGKKGKVGRAPSAATAGPTQPRAAAATPPVIAAEPAPRAPRDRQFDPIRNPLACFSEQTGASFG
jgi:hypothetical protein